MDTDVENNNNQNKHWTLVIIGKVQDLLFVILGFFVILLGLIINVFEGIWRYIPVVRRFIKRIVKTLSEAASILIILYIGVYGYMYYTKDYIPKKRLDEAVADIERKLNAFEVETRAGVGLDILRTDSSFKYYYYQVPDSAIRSRIYIFAEDALRNIHEIASGGDERYQKSLGDLYYYDNDHIENDYAKAAYWWNEAAQQGYTYAFGYIGYAYLNGIGVKKNPRLALEWLKKGAELDDSNSQYLYGNLFLEGVKVKIGSHKEENTTLGCTVDDYDTLVPVDIEQAKYWWRKAADAWDERAKDALQKIYD